MTEVNVHALTRLTSAHHNPTHLQEIDQAVAKTKEYMSATGRESSVLVLPLYASLPHHLQMKAIGAAPRYVERKVIFATNIAETSLTIDGTHCPAPPCPAHNMHDIDHIPTCVTHLRFKKKTMLFGQPHLATVV